MNPITRWIQKEIVFILKDLNTFTNYYTLRDRIPFYVTLIYLVGLKTEKKLTSLLSTCFLIYAVEFGSLSFYYLITGTPTNELTGFHWIHIAPIQYTIVILILAIIGFISTKDISYSTALGFNGASAIGYLYETPFWLFSRKYDQAHFIHTSPRFVFFLDYQIISIAVFIWLLKQQKISFRKQELTGFLLAYGITFIMASKMYVWQTLLIARLPMMFYSIYLTSQINGGLKPTLIKIQDKTNRVLYRLKKTPFYFSNIKNNPELSKGEVACIMCVWNEQPMVPLALESSKDFVSRYIIIDKNGETTPTIEKYAKLWNLNIEIYIKPKMSLRESRLFAASKISEPWILIQDGDEVFHTDGETNISNLRNHMNQENVIFCSKMTVLMGDLKHTRNSTPFQPPHKFLIHNNGTVKGGLIQDDIPDSNSYLITLEGIWKFNCIIKHPKRQYLRKFWNQWCKETDSYKKYPEIEDYVREELGINIEEEYKTWYKEKIESLVPYEEKKFGNYPATIRRHIT